MAELRQLENFLPLSMEYSVTFMLREDVCLDEQGKL